VLFYMTSIGNLIGNPYCVVESWSSSNTAAIKVVSQFL